MQIDPEGRANLTYKVIKFLFGLVYHLGCGDFPNGEDLLPIGQSTSGTFCNKMILHQKPNLLGCKNINQKSVE